jgi:hypothetical protein
VRRIVDWPRDIRPQAIITIGWPAKPIERKTKRMDVDEVVKRV